MKYRDEMIRAMTWLGTKDDVFFIGQSVVDEGTGIFKTLQNVPIEKRLELPVFEETQMGMSTGIALRGSIPVSIYPRWDFLLLASNQLINHLNRMKDVSHGEFQPKVIIRTAVGSAKPLDPQFQHKNDYTEAFFLMLDNIEVIKLTTPNLIFSSYERAYTRNDGKSTLLVEISDYYNECFRVCCKCKIEKILMENYYKDCNDASGFRYICKMCSNIQTQNYRLSHPECIRYIGKKYYKKNAQIINQKVKVYNSKTESKITRNFRQRKKYNEEPTCKLLQQVRNSVNYYCRKFETVKKLGSTWKHLPYSPQQLKEHLEKQFESWMSWDNWGKFSNTKQTWQIDHIVPQSKLPYDSLDHSNFRKCWALENLRPLEAIENIRKGNK